MAIEEMTTQCIMGASSNRIWDRANSPYTQKSIQYGSELQYNMRGWHGYGFVCLFYLLVCLFGFIREVRPEHGRYRVQRKANCGAIRPTSNIVSWQRTARVWTESRATWSVLSSWMKFHSVQKSGSAQSWTLLIGHVNDIAFCIILTPFTNSL